MSDSDEAEILYLIWKTKIKKKKRNMWVRNLFLDRETLGEFHYLKPQLDVDDLMFYNYYRMNKTSYDLLILKLEPFFKIKHTHCRKSISLEERLAVTIRYLATGENYHSASFRFRISHNQIGVIVSQMLPMLYSALVKDYLKFPDKEGFVKISEEFMNKKNFPNCLGAIDGKLVRIHNPARAGSLFYNSIILFTTINANNVFTMIDVGSYGNDIDGGVFNLSKFGQMFNNEQLELPANKTIDNSHVTVPYVFVGDEAFRLTEHLLKPYPRRELNITSHRYNCRLSHARQVVQYTFDILVSKFRIFGTSVAIYPEKVDNLIKAACVLHNFIRLEENSSEEFERADLGAFTNLVDLPQYAGRGLNQSKREARLVREKFAEYFSGVGSVEWQDDGILTTNENQQIENI